MNSYKFVERKNTPITNFNFKSLVKYISFTKVIKYQILISTTPKHVNFLIYQREQVDDTVGLT